MSQSRLSDDKAVGLGVAVWIRLSLNQNGKAFHVFNDKAAGWILRLCLGGFATTPAVAYSHTAPLRENGFALIVGTGFTEKYRVKILSLPNLGDDSPRRCGLAVNLRPRRKYSQILELSRAIMTEKDTRSGTAIKTAELIAEVRVYSARC